MSHEIRTPMNSIIGFSHLLKRNNISEEKTQDNRLVKTFFYTVFNFHRPFLNMINAIIDRILSAITIDIKTPFGPILK